MRQDICIDENYQLKIENGDFKIIASDTQHIHFIIKSHRGNWNQHPNLGYGEHNFKNAIIDGAQKRLIKLQCQSDGYRLKLIRFFNNILRIEI